MTSTSYLRNRYDSQQLDWLRTRYIDAGRARPATPYRLGIYAAKTSTKIDDYGAHSARWRQQFNAGFTAGCELLNDWPGSERISL